ncbi:MAG: lytic transglycosylase domain-containing protein [Synergistaceae bacterium]|nr:lytic transglycosylase domain-containing protein [Synergistaceae bacterium]
MKNPVRAVSALLLLILSAGCLLLLTEMIRRDSAADWKAGWLAWKRGDYAAALECWNGSLAAEPFAIRPARLSYWKIRALEKLGRRREAELAASLLALRHPLDFYSFVLAYEGRYPKLTEAAARAKASSPYPRGWRDEVAEASTRTGVPQDILYALILKESKFKEKAVSRAGAVGLMQLMPPTAREAAARLKEEGLSPYKPSHNVMLGATHFAYLAEKFHGRLPLAVAAYNAGASAVSGWKIDTAENWVEWIEDIPYPQTREYVRSVLENLEVYSAGSGTAARRSFFAEAAKPILRHFAQEARGKRRIIKEEWQ